MRTDEERLNWLERNQAGVWPVMRTVRSPLTDGTWGCLTEQVRDGWQAGSLSNPCAETLREAIDNAIEDN